MQTVLLIMALSIDVFLACAACGTENIKIERKTALCISFVCSGVLFLSLSAGSLLSGMMKENDVKVLAFVGLFLVGVFKLTEYGVKRYVRKHKFLCKHVKITVSQLQFILSIYNNPVMADKDHSKVMSVTEGIFFALAMSVDGLFGGLGAGFLELNIFLTTVCNFLLGIAAVQLGSMAGRKAVLKTDVDVSWLGGAMFVLLAFGKIL